MLKKNIVRVRDWCKFCGWRVPLNGVLLGDVFICDECITSVCIEDHGEEPVDEEQDA